MHKWTNEEICEEFDNNPNITVKQLARMTGKTTSEIVAILMR